MLPLINAMTHDKRADLNICNFRIINTFLNCPSMISPWSDIYILWPPKLWTGLTLCQTVMKSYIFHCLGITYMCIITVNRNRCLGDQESVREHYKPRQLNAADMESSTQKHSYHRHGSIQSHSVSSLDLKLICAGGTISSEVRPQTPLV